MCGKKMNTPLSIDRDFTVLKINKIQGVKILVLMIIIG